MPQRAEGRLPPNVVHALPSAPAFSGRQDELRKLREFWQSGQGVVSLIGIGGAGKTALAQRFLETFLAEEPPDGLLVWSFYDDPDANHFLKTAYEYFTGGSQAHASGAGWFSPMGEVLSSGKRFLLILDGLER
ncbi:MAG: ATP-binding protein, partial [Chloroflexi bacterium]|nr:ATP-binding protein [Chloroflexota bacterium]